MRLGVSPAATSNPTGVFNQRCEALFPHAGALGCRVCLAPQFPLGVSPHECGTARSSIRHLAGSASLCVAESPLDPLPISAPPTGLSECFFISLVVRLPYSLIFCQFWAFLFFNLSFFRLCDEAQCVYLRLHLGQKPSFLNILKISSFNFP